MVRDFHLRRIPASFRYAWRGLWHVLRTEHNLRIHLAATLLAVVLAILLHISEVEWAVLALTIGFVIFSEVLNSVIEDFLDVIHPSQHESVRRIKDVLAGAVLFSAFIALVVGVLLFGSRLVAWLSGSSL